MAKSAKPVIIITGVSSGIGLEAARRFVAADWIVVGTMRTKKRPEDLATLAIDLQQAEMTKPQDLAKLVDRTVETYGRIDAVLANAGYGLVGPVEQLDYRAVDHQLAVNLQAPIELIRLVLPVMKKQKRGTIAVVSSIAGRMGFAGYGAYAASKFGIEGFMESLWYEVAGYGIKVKLIEPSRVETPFWKNLVKVGPRRTAAGTKRPAPKQRLSGEVVAKVCFDVITGRGRRLRYGVGLTSLVVAGKRLLPESWFSKIASRFIGNRA